MRHLVPIVILLVLQISFATGSPQARAAQSHAANVAAPQQIAAGESATTLQAATTQQQARTKAAHPVERSRDLRGFSFVRNTGQAGPDILWTSQGPQYRASFSSQGFVLETAKAVGPGARHASEETSPLAAASAGMPSLRGPAPQMEWSEQRIAFAGASPAAEILPLDELPGQVSLFEGSDPRRWISGAHTFARLRYKNVYPGIDVVFYGHEGRLEYDFVVSPGADPGAIRMSISGTELPVVTADGSLQLGSFVHHPQLYQNFGDGKRIVDGRFLATADRTVGFTFDHYDRSRTFIIDPAISLVYSSYAGGIHNDQEFGLATDAKGNSYIAGWAASQDFPVTGNALQATRQNIGTYTYDAVVLKFDSSGTLIYSTFLGGSSNDQAGPIVVNPDGTVYVAGYTQSSDFPVTPGAYQAAYGGGLDGFLARISADGSQLLYSTYLGGPGDEAVTSLLLNTDGSLWMSGVASSAGLTPSANALQKVPKGVDNSFIAKAQFSQAGVLQLPYLTFIGGSQRGQTNGPGEGWPSSLAVDAAGNVYYAGTTQSSDFPVTANAYEQPFTLSHGCANDPYPNTTGVVTKLSPDLSQMLYSTYYGGKTEDQLGFPYCNQGISAIRLDSTGNIWLYGYTAESDLPTTSNALSSKLNTTGNANGQDAFLGELSPDGTKLLYGTYIGGSGLDSASSMVFDASGNIWLSGITESTDFPVTANALQMQNSAAVNDLTVSQLSPDGTKLLYSTYFGGTTDNGFYGANLVLDAAGNVHLAGSTTSVNFPVTGNAFQNAFASGDANPDGADIFYSVLGSGEIGSVSPASGGNSRDLSITVTGSGFQIGATCKLTLGGTTIVSSAASVSPAGTSIACTFALNGATAGAYQVQVLNPNSGSTFTSTAPLTLQSGGGPSLWANIVGRPKIRTGVPSVVTVSYGNSGNADSYLTQLQVNLPPGVTATYDVGVAPSLGSGVQIPSSRATSSGSTIALIVPHLAAGESHSLQLSITDSTNNDNYTISASVSLPWYSSLAQAMTDLTAQSKAFTPAAACQPAFATAPGVHNCLGLYLSQYQAGGATTAQTQALAATLLQQLQQALIGTQPTVSTGTSPLPTSSYVNGTLVVDGLPSVDDTELVHDFGTSTQYLFPIDTGHCVVSAADTSNALGAVLYKCTYSIPSPISGAQQFTGNSYSRLDLITNPTALFPQFDSCWTKTFNVPGAGFQLNVHAGSPCGVSADAPDDDDDEMDDIDPLPPVILPGTTGGAIDPNAKVGNTGDGSAKQYINGATPLPYAVYFENVATASLPAAGVVITDQLDPTKVDLSTLRFGSVSFGTNIIKPLQDASSFDTTYSLNTSLSVRIQASVNPGTGLLRWTFQSIDPSTGLAPTDPTVGFLPPDSNGIVGQGSVVFTVTPKTGLTTGTQIMNAASVVFDTNAPINTPGWLNTLDVDAPVSKVTALPATEPPTFSVAWSGTDNGSGIASYNIYVSDNGGAFTLWQGAVSATSASYTGIVGHTYAFVSAATDKAFNAEAVRPGADTSTSVVSSAAAATLTNLTASTTNPVFGSPVTFTAVVASATGVPAGTVSFLDGANVLGTAVLNASGQAAFSTSTLAVGAHSITASYAATSSFAASTSTVLTVTVQAVPVADFTLSLSPTSGSVSAGQAATTTLTLTPSNGFTQAVSFSCSGLPAGATCTFTPATVTPNGAAAQATLVIQTAAAHALSNPRSAPGRRTGLPLLAGGLVCFLCVGFKRRRLLMFCLLAALAIGAVGCGSNSFFQQTTPTTSTITVNAASGSTSHSATYTLTTM